MANHKPRKASAQDRSTGKQPSESSPNPHGEHKVIEMPVRTGHKRETRGQNVAGTPSTVGGELNPSVAHDFPSRAGVVKNKPQQRRKNS